LRTFFGRIKTAFIKFEKDNPFEKLKAEIEELGLKWFASREIFPYEIQNELNQKGKIVSFLESSCDDKRFFEILNEFYETKIDKDKTLKRGKDEDANYWSNIINTGRLADFRNAMAHTNEIQLAVNIEALVYSFNDAKYLLRYLRFMQGEDWFPNFVEYDFKLLEESEEK